MPDSRKPPFRQSSAGFLANHMARLFTRALAEALQPLDLAVAQFMVLLELWEEDGLTQRQLVQRLDVEQGTMNSTLNRMERDRLISRRPHATDGRAQTIHAMPHAVALKAGAMAVAHRVNAAATATLGTAEQMTMIASMTQVISSLSASAPVKPSE